VGNLYTIGGVLKQPPDQAFDVEGLVLECKPTKTKAGKDKYEVKVKDDTGTITLAFWDSGNLPPAGAIVKLIDCTAAYYEPNKTWYFNGKVWIAKQGNPEHPAPTPAPAQTPYTLQELAELMAWCIHKFPPQDAEGQNTGWASTVFIQACRLGLKAPKDVPY
jgi:hypothetical protein